MANHYHLLVETPVPNLSKGMQLLNGVYTQRFNRAEKRHGHVFQGRFKAILVEKESYLLELARYVALNPVRAKIVRSAKDWPWSSYRATGGLAGAHGFLTVDWILSQFGVERRTAMHAYRRFVSRGRDADVWRGLRAGSLLGSEEFVEEMRSRLAEVPPNPNVLRRERSAARPTLEELFSNICDKQARNQCIHDTVRKHHYTLQEVGDHLGLHFSTVSVIAKRASENRGIRK